MSEPAMAAVTDTDAAVNDAVVCAWPDAPGGVSAPGRVVSVSADHVTVLLDAPIDGAIASYVAFPRESNIAGLSCKRQGG